MSRADLARLLDTLPAEDASRTASLLGFEEVPEIQPVAHLEQRISQDTPPEETTFPDETASLAGAPQRAPVVPFWRLEEMTFTDPPEEKVERARPHLEEPLNEDDLTNPGRSLLATPPTEPLTPWSRLWPVVREALHSRVPGRDPDVPALLRAWNRGEIVRRLPRVTRRVWASRASVWIDRSPRLVPFWSDQLDVARRIHDACSKSGVSVRVLDAPAQAWSRVVRGDFLAGFRADPETPVLVLGDLGLHGTETERAAWLSSARRLRRAAVPVAALVPVPPCRWDGIVTKEWSARAWESGHAVSAGRGLELLQTRADRLLRLISPAALVQPGLLRALRQLLPAHEADAGTEIDVFRHADVLAADASGIVLRPEASARWREAFAAEESAERKEQVSRTIARWREGTPKELLRGETLAWLSVISPEVAETTTGGAGGAPPGDIEDALKFAGRLEVSSKLHALSRRGDGAPLTRQEAMRAAVIRGYSRAVLSSMPARAYDVVPGLKVVWAATFEGESGVTVPEGIDPGALYEELGQPGEPRWWGVRQVGRELVFSPSPSAAWPSHDRGPGSPVAWILVQSPHLFVRRGEERGWTQLVLEEGLTIPLRSGEGLSLRSDRSAVWIGVWQRESWAVAAGRDRFGLWAEADVKGIPVRFRWIPPGRFWMGSPENEAGRYEQEGPRHQVTWTTGRWLGDAPVTQELWKAVMSENPSRFVSPDRPVEQVSWYDCQTFLREVNNGAGGLDARLPGEAEWEYACRAGAETATWLGDFEILGENNAPSLDSIAWYGGNCGRDFNMLNGFDRSRWPSMQYKDLRGGTHPVRKKAANPWGLYDILGNVFEWCLDHWSYEPYSTGDRVDPPSGASGSSPVFRGGSWFSRARNIRAANRLAAPPDVRYDHLGFRLVAGPAPGPRSAALGPRGGGSKDTEQLPSRGLGRTPVTEGRDVSGKDSK